MIKQTPLQRYLQICPTALNDEQRLFGLIADALENDIRKIHALQFAYKAGIVELLREEGTLADDQRERIRIRLTQEYAMVPETAMAAIRYWEYSLTEEICREADCGRQKKDQLVNLLSADENQLKNAECIELCLIRQDRIHGGITIQWNRRSDITRYEIWRAECDEKAVCIEQKRFSLPRYSDLSVQPGMKYAYAVRGWIGEEELETDILSNDAELFAPDVDDAFQISEIKAAREGISLRWSICFGAAAYSVLKRCTENANWQEVAELSNMFSQWQDSDAHGKRFYKIRCVLRDGSIRETRDVRVNARFTVG